MVRNLCSEKSVVCFRFSPLIRRLLISIRGIGILIRMALGYCSMSSSNRRRERESWHLPSPLVYKDVRSAALMHPFISHLSTTPCWVSRFPNVWKIFFGGKKTKKENRGCEEEKKSINSEKRRRKIYTTRRHGKGNWRNQHDKICRIGVEIS